ncbi:hypothetical protein [Caenibacillus caldisaponilyticus]|uniref:hypothetical protein n=1 Tax=Caenibacillus caldisaponilyticus TaxID=1674942 RepID=UPI001EE6E58A|nr:hypothetical protein [Caenibacillus caldisaponilyticus]
MISEKMGFLKNKWFRRIAIIVVVIIVVAILINAGYSSGYEAGQKNFRGKFNGKVASYNDVVQKLSDIEKEYKEKSDQLSQLQTELASKQNEYDELKQLEANRDTMKQQVESAKDDLRELKSQISEAQDKLSSLRGQIDKANGAPIRLEAGKFTVGDDVKPGRYKVQPIGEGSNFIVYDSTGYPKVNTILGSGGVPSYTFEAEDGDIIQNEAPAKLTPVK